VTLVAIPAGAVLFIAATTGLAAWRAGRVPPVPTPLPSVRGGAATPPVGGRLSAPGPPALVLAWHTAFPRRTRSLTTVARLALPLLLIVVAMSAWTTISRFHSEP